MELLKKIENNINKTELGKFLSQFLQNVTRTNVFNKDSLQSQKNLIDLITILSYQIKKKFY